MTQSGRDKIIFPFAGETKGGSLQSTLLLIRKLRALGVDAQAVCHGTGFAHDEALRQGVPVLLIPGFGGKRENADRADGLRLANFLSMGHVLRVIHKLRPALIHLNEKRMIRTWAIPARICRVPLLVHWRTNYRPSLSMNLGLRLARRIICISRFSASALPTWAQAKSKVVYNPIDAAPAEAERQAMRAAKRASLGLADSDRLIGFFGNFSWRKRPYLLLEAVAKLRAERGPHIRGLLCGSVTPPPDERYLQRLAERDWADCVFMPGFVHDAPAWMAACDVIMAPAFDEPWGRTLAEAQSLGVPIIASSDGGHLETIRHGQDGLFVDSAEPEAWTEAIAGILGDSRLRTRLIAGGLASAAGLSVDRHVGHVLDVYREMGLPIAT